MKNIYILTTTLLLSTVDLVSAKTFTSEFGGASYADSNKSMFLTALGANQNSSYFLSGAGQETNINFSYKGKVINFKKKDDFLTKQLQNSDKVTESSLNAAVDQGVKPGSVIGALSGHTKSALGKSSYIGVRGSQWWRSNTLQSTLQYRRTTSHQASLDYTDTDGKRIVTPESLDGKNTQLALTHLTSPSTILNGAVSHTVSSDRPDAFSITSEIRQYLPIGHSSIHIGATHYENVGKIEDTSTSGTVVANTVKAEIFTKIKKNYIAMFGYRLSIEQENPRSDSAPIAQTGSDTYYSSFKYRFGNSNWLEDSNELQIFGSLYDSNQSTNAILIGVGAKLILDSIFYK